MFWQWGRSTIFSNEFFPNYCRICDGLKILNKKRYYRIRTNRVLITIKFVYLIEFIYFFLRISL